MLGGFKEAHFEVGEVILAIILNRLYFATKILCANERQPLIAFACLREDIVGFSKRCLQGVCWCCTKSRRTKRHVPDGVIRGPSGAT